MGGERLIKWSRIVVWGIRRATGIRRVCGHIIVGRKVMVIYEWGPDVGGPEPCLNHSGWIWDPLHTTFSLIIQLSDQNFLNLSK